MKRTSLVLCGVAAFTWLGCATEGDEMGQGGGGGGTAGNAGMTGSGGAGTGGAAGAGAGGGSGGGSGGADAGAADRGGTGGSGGADAGSADRGGGGGADAGATGRGGGGGAGGTAGAGGGAGGAAGAGSYNPCPTNGDACKVLPLGDSITWGIQYEGAYRVELFRRAVAANQRITYVGSLMDGPTTVSGMTFPRNNEGHSGWTINQVAGLIPNPALMTNPDIILLLIGTNDTYMGDPGGAPQRLGMLLDKILSMNSHALLAVSLITPYPAQAANVATYNKAVPPLVQARAAAGKHIILVDLNTGFTSAMLSSDGIHPNQSGYDFMGGVWYAAVGSLFPK